MRWWDHWLKGDRQRHRWTSRSCAPGCRSRSRPAPDYDERPGPLGRRAVAGRRPASSSRRLALERGHARRAPGAAIDAAHPLSPQTRRRRRRRLVRRTATRPTCPRDQRARTRSSLSFTSAPLDASRCELLGRPSSRCASPPTGRAALVAARLCDVAPDGASTLVTRGVLNLSHRDGHDGPRRSFPGERTTSSPAQGVGYACRPATACALALSTTLLAVALAVARAGDADGRDRRRRARSSSRCARRARRRTLRRVRPAETRRAARRRAGCDRAPPVPSSGAT